MYVLESDGVAGIEADREEDNQEEKEECEWDYSGCDHEVKVGSDCEGDDIFGAWDGSSSSSLAEMLDSDEESDNDPEATRSSAVPESWHHENARRRLDVYFDKLERAFFAYCTAKAPPTTPSTCSIECCSLPPSVYCPSCAIKHQSAWFCFGHGSDHAKFLGHQAVDTHGVTLDGSSNLPCCSLGSDGVDVQLVSTSGRVDVCRVLVCRTHPSPAETLLGAGLMASDFTKPGIYHACN